MLKKFSENDIFHNVIKAYPKKEFYIYDRKVFLDRKSPIQGEFQSVVDGTQYGTIDINEILPDSPADHKVYPFITKGGSLTSFSTVSTDAFNQDFNYGDVITGSYPLTSSINIDRYVQGQDRPHILALRNRLDNYKKISNHYSYSSSLGDKSDQEINVISFPSIFYGSSIKRGSFQCDFYVSGSLLGRLEDKNKNGELIQTLPYGSNGSGSVAGIVMYNEGFVILTGSWDISNGNHTEPYIPGELAVPPAWKYFASTGSTGASENLPSSSFFMTYEGTQYIPTITMLCHAEEGEMNFSNNPTYIQYGQEQKLTPISSSTHYVESDKVLVANVASSSYAGTNKPFEKITYISTIGIYDRFKNLIAVAKLANPLKKKETQSYTIKVKLDF